ncbi:MAG: alpha/beta hydrolase [Dermatophilaceae bacterium]
MVAANLTRATLARPATVPCAELQRGDTPILPEGEVDNTEKTTTINGGRFIGLVYQLVFASLAGQVPVATATADSGSLERVAQLEELLSGGSGIADGMFLSVACAEEQASLDTEAMAARVAQTQPAVQVGFGSDGGLATADQCAIWDVPAADLDTYGPEPGSGSTRTLVVAGRFDPITPVAFGRQIEEVVQDTTVVEGAAVGHDPASALGECGAEVVGSFVAGDAVESACAAVPVEFLIPSTASTKSLSTGQDSVSLAEKAAESTRGWMPVPVP